jgi:hypothetical protein
MEHRAGSRRIDGASSRLDGGFDHSLPVTGTERGRLGAGVPQHGAGGEEHDVGDCRRITGAKHLRYTHLTGYAGKI